MGSFAANVLRIMLGWVRTAAVFIWNLVSGSQQNRLVLFIGQHWLVCVILLCVFGMVIDWGVNLARWRNDLVYRSFFRRIFKKRNNIEENTAKTKNRNKKTAANAIRAIKNSLIPEDENIVSYKPVKPDIDKNEAYNQPYVPSSWHENKKPTSRSGER